MDATFLEETLQGAWHAMPGDSLNAGAGPHRVRILKASSRHRRTLRALLGLLCRQFSEAAVDCRAPSAPRGEGMRPEAAA